MKKILYAAAALLLVLSLPACGSQKDGKTIKIGATASPHAEILEAENRCWKRKGIRWRSWSSRTMFCPTSL